MFLRSRALLANDGKEGGELTFGFDDLPVPAEAEHKAEDESGDEGSLQGAFAATVKSSPKAVEPAHPSESDFAPFELTGLEEVLPEPRPIEATVVASARPFETADNDPELEAAERPFEEAPAEPFQETSQEAAEAAAEPFSFELGAPGTVPETPLPAEKDPAAMDASLLSFSLELGASEDALQKPLPKEKDPAEIDSDLISFSVALGPSGDFASTSEAVGFQPSFDASAPALELGAAGEGAQAPEVFASPGASEKSQFVEDVLLLATGLSSPQEAEPAMAYSPATHATSDGALAGDWGVKLQTNVEAMPAGAGLLGSQKARTPDVLEKPKAAKAKGPDAEKKAPAQRAPEVAEKKPRAAADEKPARAEKSEPIPLWNLGELGGSNAATVPAAAALEGALDHAAGERGPASGGDFGAAPEAPGGLFGSPDPAFAAPPANAPAASGGLFGAASAGEDALARGLFGATLPPNVPVPPSAGGQGATPGASDSSGASAGGKRARPRRGRGNAPPAGGGGGQGEEASTAMMSSPLDPEMTAVRMEKTNARTSIGIRFLSGLRRGNKSEGGKTAGSDSKARVRIALAIGAAAILVVGLGFVVLDEELAQEFGLGEVRALLNLNADAGTPTVASSDGATGEGALLAGATGASTSGAGAKKLRAKGKAGAIALGPNALKATTSIEGKEGKEGKGEDLGGATTAEFEELPTFDFSLLGANAQFFQGIDEAIVRGDFLLAKKRFSQQPLQAPEQPPEMAAARGLLARYALGVSNLTRASTVLLGDCKAVKAENAAVCVHHARALVSAGKSAEARKVLAQGKELGAEWSQFGLVTSLTEAAASALSDGTVSQLRPLLTHYITQSGLNSEWHLQRSVWIVRAIARLHRQERFALAKEILQARRSDWEAVFASPEGAYNRAADMIFIPYLNSLAVEFELPPFATPTARMRYDSDVAAMGLILQATRRASVESSQSVLSSLVSLRGRVPMSDIVRVFQMNLALNDNDLGIVGQALETVRTTKEASLLFRYEWSLIGARLAVQTNSAEAWAEAFRELLAAAHTQPRAAHDFSYWLQQSRLLRLMRKDPSIALRRARQLALTPREKGLVEVEQASIEKALGKGKEAFARLQRAVRDFPHHGQVLQAAAEMAGQEGTDPTTFIKKQSAIPDAFLRRSQDAPALSDVTLLEILEKI